MHGYNNPLRSYYWVLHIHSPITDLGSAKNDYAERAYSVASCCLELRNWIMSLPSYLIVLGLSLPPPLLMPLSHSFLDFLLENPAHLDIFVLCSMNRCIWDPCDEADINIIFIIAFLLLSTHRQENMRPFQEVQRKTTLPSDRHLSTVQVVFIYWWRLSYSLSSHGAFSETLRKYSMMPEALHFHLTASAWLIPYRNGSSMQEEYP